MPDRDGHIRASDQSFFNKGDCYQGEPQNDDERRVFALVIGIDEYKSRDVPPLRGCKNDGEDFVRLLVNDLFIPEDRIKKLFNEDAERSSIINGFWNHLVWNPDIRKGDVVLFYFSGHGASATAPEGWAAERKQIEILCPYDYDPKNGVYGIPDYTLDALMQSLKDNKGDNIVCLRTTSLHERPLTTYSSTDSNPRLLPLGRHGPRAASRGRRGAGYT